MMVSTWMNEKKATSFCTLNLTHNVGQRGGPNCTSGIIRVEHTK